MTEAIVALGTNIGNRKENLYNAIKSINLVPSTTVCDVSKFYETLPFEVPDVQNNYMNCCIKVLTELSANALLGVCLGIEASMGRIRKFRFSSRIIDIDLLLYKNLKINTNELILPHPRIKERAFVMYPLRDICPKKSFYDFNFAEEFEKIDKSEIKSIFS